MRPTYSSQRCERCGQWAHSKTARAGVDTHVCSVNCTAPTKSDSRFSRHDANPNGPVSNATLASTVTSGRQINAAPAIPKAVRPEMRRTVPP